MSCFSAIALASVLVIAPPVIAQTSAWKVYQQRYETRMVPLLVDAVRFQTFEGNEEAHRQQREWLRTTASELGLVFRDSGPVTEVELPGPAGAPVLGLIVHGDVQKADASEWSDPPFAGIRREAVVCGRGTADDKGPMVQALLAIAALKDSGLERKHTIRLLVGSDEESNNKDFTTYLVGHRPPDLSLVLDSAFPVVVGEKAWNGFEVIAKDPYRTTESGKATIVELSAGLSASIVPARAFAVLQAPDETAAASVEAKLKAAPSKEGLREQVTRKGRRIEVAVTGRSAHSGMNIEGGRNALLRLAQLLEGVAAKSGASDLLGYALKAGSDLHGRGLGLDRADPLWGRNDVNVATIEAETPSGALKLTINIRTIPGLSGKDLRKHLEDDLTAYNQRSGSGLEPGKGYFEDTILAFNPESKIVRRLASAYSRVMGPGTPLAISGGGTYAKRVPNSIAFGMWFPGKPYPGHDANEKVDVADLHKGVKVLLEALTDLAGSPMIERPFEP